MTFVTAMVLAAAALVVFLPEHATVDDDEHGKCDARHERQRAAGHEAFVDERPNGSHHEYRKRKPAEIRNEAGARTEHARFCRKAALALAVKFTAGFEGFQRWADCHVAGESTRFTSVAIRSSGATLSTTPICTAAFGMP